MQNISFYTSPLGEILLAADELGLTGLWFRDQKYYARGHAEDHREQETPVLTAAKAWLDAYFAGKNPEVSFPLHLVGTEFQKAVWEILCTIPYGKTMTYGEIGKILAKKMGRETMSAQAVGGAVGRNPVSVIVPCHRVVGAGGSLTGYAGGIEKKIALLELEGIQAKNACGK